MPNSKTSKYLQDASAAKPRIIGDRKHLPMSFAKNTMKKRLYEKPLVVKKQRG